MEFNSTPTTIQCIQYGAGQMPGGMNLADNVVCQALLKNGQRYEIFSADGNAIQSTAKTLGLDVEPPTLAPIKYYTDESFTTEITPGTWYNKPVVALAVCNDTPLNEAGDCACSPTVHPSTTDASLWTQGIPNNLLGADVMRYTRTITDTLSGPQNIQITDTAGNISTTQTLAVSLDTTPPQVTVTESGTGATKSVTITASDSGSKIWKTRTPPTDTKNTKNEQGIVYRVGPKTDLAQLKFDTNCDSTAIFASPAETQAASFPAQAILTLPNFNISSQIMTYCVRDNAGNTKRGIYPAIIDSCFSATNMPIIPDLDSYKNLTKTRLQGTGNDNFKYGYSFSANPQDAACFRGILSTNITTLVTNQLIPRTTTTLSNWEADPALVRNFPNLPNTNGYYYYAFSGGNNTLSINSTPTGTGQKSVVVDGGNIRITHNLLYSGGDKILLLIAQKDADGKGGDIIIEPSVTRIDAILIASGGALKTTNSSTPAERLTINGRIYSYNTRG